MKDRNDAIIIYESRGETTGGKKERRIVWGTEGLGERAGQKDINQNKKNMKISLLTVSLIKFREEVKEICEYISTHMHTC